MRSLALMVALTFATVAVAPALALAPVHSLTYQSAVEQAKYKASGRPAAANTNIPPAPRATKKR